MNRDKLLVLSSLREFRILLTLGICISGRLKLTGDNTITRPALKASDSREKFRCSVPGRGVGWWQECRASNWGKRHRFTLGLASAVVVHQICVLGCSVGTRFSVTWWYNVERRLLVATFTRKQEDRLRRAFEDLGLLLKQGLCRGKRLLLCLRALPTSPGNHPFHNRCVRRLCRLPLKSIKNKLRVIWEKVVKILDTTTIATSYTSRRMQEATLWHNNVGRGAIFKRHPQIARNDGKGRAGTWRSRDTESQLS